MTLVMFILMSAYFIRGITGFGSALISVPLLALSQVRGALDGAARTLRLVREGGAGLGV